MRSVKKPLRPSYLRKCSVCGIEALTEDDLKLFAKCKGVKYGRKNICYKCRNARSRKRHEDHPEKRREYLKKYRESSNKRIDYEKKYRESNRERLNEYMRKWRGANPEKVKESERKFREANREMLNEKSRKYNKAYPFKSVLRGAKSRSKDFGLAFDIDLEYLKQLWEECGGICTMTGIEMKKQSLKHDPFTMSLDRIIPDKGYIKGNVRFISFWYNVSKSNWSDKFVLEMCRRVVEVGVAD